jgi:hypothetical protein
MFINDDDDDDNNNHFEEYIKEHKSLHISTYIYIGFFCSSLLTAFVTERVNDWFYMTSINF